MRWILQALNLTNLSFFLSPLRSYCWNLTLQDSTVKSHCRIQKQHSEPFVTIKSDLCSLSGGEGRVEAEGKEYWWISQNGISPHCHGENQCDVAWNTQVTTSTSLARGGAGSQLNEMIRLKHLGVPGWSFRLLPVLWEAYSMLPDPALQQETTCGWWLASTPANASASQRRWDPYSLMQ